MNCTDPKFNSDADRCVCGGQIVYFEEEGTHGCEVGGPVWVKGKRVDGFLKPYPRKKW